MVASLHKRTVWTAAKWCWAVMQAEVQSREAEVADLWGRLEAQQPLTPDQVLMPPAGSACYWLQPHLHALVSQARAGVLPWQSACGAAVMTAGSMRHTS